MTMTAAKGMNAGRITLGMFWSHWMGFTRHLLHLSVW